MDKDIYRGFFEKIAKWGKKIKIEQPGKYKDRSLESLIAARDSAKKAQEAHKASGNKTNPSLTEKLRELNFAIRAKTGWGKAK